MRLRRTFGHGVLTALVLSLSTTLLLAQSPNSTPAPGSPGAKEGSPLAKTPDMRRMPIPEPAGGKGAEPKAGESTGAKAIDPKPGESTVKAVEKRSLDKMQLRKEQQETEYAKLPLALRAQPISDSLKQEMLRHSRRMSRLERVKAVAGDGKDVAVVDRVDKLIEKEKARHDKFMATFDAKDDKLRTELAKDDQAKADKAKDDKAKAERAKGEKAKEDKGGAK